MTQNLQKPPTFCTSLKIYEYLMFFSKKTIYVLCTVVLVRTIYTIYILFHSLEKVSKSHIFFNWNKKWVLFAGFKAFFSQKTATIFAMIC